MRQESINKQIFKQFQKVEKPQTRQTLNKPLSISLESQGNSTKLNYEI